VDLPRLQQNPRALQAYVDQLAALPAAKLRQLARVTEQIRCGL